MSLNTKNSFSLLFSCIEKKSSHTHIRKESSIKSPLKMKKDEKEEFYYIRCCCFHFQFPYSFHYDLH